MKGPKLRFGRDATPTGFAATATAFFDDLRPARIVRELLQNSIDAAADAREAVARVRFRVTMISPETVPDIRGYTKAFREAIQFGKKVGGGLSTPDQRIVNRISAALARLENDGDYMLAVMDNGVGLNDERMTAILGDGISNKSGSSAGSYGVGHFTAVPTSDLRYLLYGGVQSDGRRIAAGAAFIASRRGSGNLFAARGYLIKKLGTGKPGKVFEFIDVADIPSTLADDLHAVQKEWGHGTVIHIPAFNWFGDEEERWSLWSIVSKVAAYNFVVAIQRGELEIEVDEGSAYVEGDEQSIMRLDRDTIGDVLDSEADRRRAARGDSFFAGLRPSGAVAHSIYQVLIRGESRVVETEFGDVTVQLLGPSPTGSTRVDLVRNGMWITDSLRDLRRSDFADRQTFHALLMPEPLGELNRLIRKAEGPMHNELSFKHLDDKQERDSLRDGLRAIRDWIRDHVPEIGTEEYTPDDFLVVETGGAADGRGNQRFSVYGTPVVVQRANMSERILDVGGEPTDHDDDEDRPKPPSPPKPPRPKPEGPSRPLPFQSTVVPLGTEAHVVSLRCIEDAEEVSLSLRLHENVDATCDRIWPDQIVLISKFAFRDTGQTPRAVRDRDGREVRVYGLVAGQTYEMVVEHAAVDAAEGVGWGVALRVVLHRPQPSSDP